MCGRFTLRTPANVLVEQFQLDVTPQLNLRFNVAPTQQVAVVRQESPQSPRSLSHIRWGLIPSWAKDVAIGARMINARGETVASKPAFRSAFRRRRCLILADGFYEWQKVGKRKQPYYLRMQDDHPFAFAGLWETWKGKDDDLLLESCTIITTEPNDVSRPIHDRMPVILASSDYDQWLNTTVQEPEELQPLIRPYPSEKMVALRVSRHVNNVRNDDPTCIAVERELF
jgi:putative SOS response-associated peptidase YedK